MTWKSSSPARESTSARRASPPRRARPQAKRRREVSSNLRRQTEDSIAHSAENARARIARSSPAVPAISVRNASGCVRSSFHESRDSLDHLHLMSCNLITAFMRTKHRTDDRLRPLIDRQEHPAEVFANDAQQDELSARKHQ